MTQEEDKIRINPIDRHSLSRGMYAFGVINRHRSAKWHGDGEPWTLADWGNALGGEVGELQNLIKKIRRLDTGAIHRDQEQDRDELVNKAILEVADVFIYLDLVLEALDPNEDMVEVVAHKFNETSAKFGFLERL